MKKLRPLILFGIGGLIYVLIELIARGRSHWSMFIVGGLAFFLIGCINEKCRKMPLVRQMLIGAIVITALEFVCGCIVNLWLGWNVWDYSNMPFNLLGQILKNEGHSQDYSIYAYIYLTDETSGNTEYQIVLHVKSRTKPENPSEEPLPEPNIFHETVVAVNASAERAEKAVSDAENIRDNLNLDLSEKITRPDTAKVGQVLTIKAIDKNGKPTEVEAKSITGGASEEAIEGAVKKYLEEHAIQESDPTVPDWAKETEKPTYTAEEVGALPKDTKIPTTLPNPQALTIKCGNKTHTYDGSEAIAITIETGGIERIEKLDTDTTVTLEPNKLYVFPEMTSLTYAIGEGTGEIHFIFKSGATATRVVHPAGVNIGSFMVDANKVYEISILEGLLTSQNWSVS